MGKPISDVVTRGDSSDAMGSSCAGGKARSENEPPPAVMKLVDALLSSRIKYLRARNRYGEITSNTENNTSTDTGNAVVFVRPAIRNEMMTDSAVPRYMRVAPKPSSLRLVGKRSTGGSPHESSL